MFENPGKKLKYRNELLLNHCRKSLQSSMRLKDMCRWSQNWSHEQVGLSKMLRGRIHKAAEETTAVRIKSDTCHQFLVLSQTFGYLGQTTICWQ